MGIVFLLYGGMTALGLIGPDEILCRLPDAIVRRIAKRSEKPKTDSGVEQRESGSVPINFHRNISKETPVVGWAGSQCR